MCLVRQLLLNTSVNQQGDIVPHQLGEVYGLHYHCSMYHARLSVLISFINQRGGVIMQQLELFPLRKRYKVTETIMKDGDILCRKVKVFDSLNLAIDTFKVGVFVLKRDSIIEVVYQ